MAFWKKEVDDRPMEVASGMKLGAAAHPEVNRIDPKARRPGSKPDEKETQLSHQEVLAQLLKTCLGQDVPPCDGPVQLGKYWFGCTRREGSSRPKLSLFLPCTKCNQLVQACTVRDALDKANETTWKTACLANSWPIPENPKDGEVHPSALELKNIILKKQSRQTIEKYLSSNKYFGVQIICQACKDAI